MCRDVLQRFVLSSLASGAAALCMYSSLALCIQVEQLTRCSICFRIQSNCVVCLYPCMLYLVTHTQNNTGFYASIVAAVAIKNNFTQQFCPVFTDIPESITVFEGSMTAPFCL